MTSRRAEPLIGEFWFPERPEPLRPTPGKIALVIVMNDNTTCTSCVAHMAILQRIHKQFPEVEITLVAKTFGWFGLMLEPPPPDREAVLIDSASRKVNRAPAYLVVSQTAFWRLPDPDRRRINEAGPNDDVYNYRSNPATMIDWSALLIDRDGQIVYTGDWKKEQEPRFAERIAALLQR